MTTDAIERSERGGSRAAGGGDSALMTERGRTTIDDTVVAKVAGMAAREVAGVYELGAGAARAWAR